MFKNADIIFIIFPEFENTIDNKIEKGINYLYLSLNIILSLILPLNDIKNEMKKDII